MSTNDSHPVARLSPADERVLDLLAEHGFDHAALDHLPAPDRPRGERILAAFRLLDDYPVSDGDETLVHATMARIALHAERQSAQFTLIPEPAAAGFGWRPRWGDLVTLAAVVALGVGTLAPVLHRVQEVSRQTACASNLAMLGGAFASYANDHNGLLPTDALTGPTVEPWDRSKNAENLKLLTSRGYCDLGCLQCPGHAGLGSSYAYRVIHCRDSALFNRRPDIALLADRNPLIDHALNGIRVTELDLPSLNHGGRGQQVLFGNLEVRWTERPVIRGIDDRPDNFWLFLDENGQESLHPGGVPLDANDNFLSQ